MQAGNAVDTNQQRRIGLTGGIGMGKTTISNYLAAKQIPVLDADVYAREAVEPGLVVLPKIAARYGANILLPDGTLDRHQLAGIIFDSLSEKTWLEQQIHPFVRDRLKTELRHLTNAPILLLVIPLLFEAQMTDLITEIWVVRSYQEQQEQRLKERDRLSPQQIRARIDGQMAIAQKVQQAHVVLDNSSTLEALYQQVDKALGI
ncbi:MAG: dephospho-CoA kinase [Timaviella obliquedivisa GSE-PSE-MK23-08B]|jgi:dephospho-CoA kinase|nr:dephospho-CoA kinase [Timaviella obliquedivisa GSE-PSE-MK23-08B]